MDRIEDRMNEGLCYECGLAFPTLNDCRTIHGRQYCHECATVASRDHCEDCGKAFTEGQRICRDDESRMAFCSTRCALLSLGAPGAQLPPP